MPNYKSRGKKSFASRPPKKNFGLGRSDANAEKFKATCSECGNSCEVPFKPTGNKPVYCHDCFGGKKISRGFDRNKPRFQNNTGELSEINSKLDKLLIAIQKITEIRS